MSGTTEVHERIHRSAALFLDVAAMPDDAAPDASPQRFADASDERVAALVAAGVPFKAVRSNGRVLAYPLGRGSALRLMALADVVHSDTRPALQRCPHRQVEDVVRPSVIVPAIRYAGCNGCVASECEARADELAAVRACDVCGSESAPLTERLLTFGWAAVIRLRTGVCCDRLADYLEPNVGGAP